MYIPVYRYHSMLAWWILFTLAHLQAVPGTILALLPNCDYRFSQPIVEHQRCMHVGRRDSVKTALEAARTF